MTFNTQYRWHLGLPICIRSRDFSSAYIVTTSLYVFYSSYSDLTSTLLEVLPTEGLNGLEILRIQNTHSLRTVPSVYNFKVLARVDFNSKSLHTAFSFIVEST